MSQQKKKTPKNLSFPVEIAIRMVFESQYMLTKNTSLDFRKFKPHV